MTFGVEQYSQLWQSSPPAFAQGARDIINDAAKQNYVASLLHESGTEKMLQTGQRIKTRLRLSAGPGNADEYGLDDELTYSQRNSGRNIEIPWSHIKADTAIHDAESLFNDIKGMNVDDQTTHVLDHVYQLDVDLFQDIMDHMDSRLMGVPDFDTMEARDSTGAPTSPKPRMYSIPALINEETNGLYPGWTTKMGINPATERNWVPTQVQYSNGSTSTFAHTQTGLIATLNNAMRRASWKAPSRFSQYFNKGNTQPSDFIWITGYTGSTLLEAALVARGDVLQTKGSLDPYMGELMYAGVPVMAWTGFDDLPIYAGANSTRVTATDATVVRAGPRFIGINKRFWHLAFHKDRMFQKQPPIRPERQPEKRILLVLTYAQQYARSLKSHIHAGPSAAA